MSLVHKLTVMKSLLIALENDRNYWKKRCVRQREALEQLSRMLLESDTTSDEILEILEGATAIADTDFSDEFKVSDLPT